MRSNRKFRQEKLKSSISILNVCLLLLLGFVGYQAFEEILSADQEPVFAGSSAIKHNTPIKSNSLPADSTLSDYKAIWERNLFNISPRMHSRQQKQKIDFVNVAKADKKVGLKLLGTAWANVSSNRFAIIENNQAQDIYHEGDTAGSFVIKKILRKKVVIATEKGDKFLTFESGDFDRKVTVASASQTLPASSKPKRSGVRFKTVALPREEIWTAFDDIDEVIEEVGTSSYKFGKLTGFEIGSVSDGSILKKIGLRSQDKILALNDRSIKDKTEAFEFFEKIAEGEKVTIKFRRRNRTRQIELNPI